MKKRTAFIISALCIALVGIAVFVFSSSAEEDNTWRNDPCDDWTLSEVTGATVEGREWYDFTDYSDEIKTDGSEDVSDLLQACVNEHDNVFLPAGRYKIEKMVNLHDNSGIKGEEGTVICIGDNYAFCASGTGSVNENGEKIKNVLVENFDMEAPTHYLKYVLYVNYIDGLTFRNINTRNCCLIDIRNLRSYYVINGSRYDDDVIEALNSNIIIRDCSAVGGENFMDFLTNQYEMACGVRIFYARQFLIENISVDHMQDGITFEGGPSMASFGGNAEMTGKFCDGKITGCTVKNCSGGGIWGQCAWRIIISNNDVSNCGDTGIDFEGGDRIIVENNRVYDTYCNFMLLDATCGHFIFRNNYSYQSGDLSVAEKYSPQHPYKYTNHMYFYNDVKEIRNTTIIVENNVFESKELSYVGAGYYTSAHMKNFVFRNNTCNNAIFSSVLWRDFADGINMSEYIDSVIENLEITNNVFNVNLPITGYFSHVIELYSADPETGIVCENNTLNTSGTGVKYAIYIEQSSNHSDVNMSVNNNTMTEGGIKLINRKSFVTNVEFDNNVTAFAFCEGRIKFTSSENNKTQKENMITEDDIYQTGLIIEPEKTNVKNTGYAPMVVNDVSLELNTLGECVWNGAEKYTFGQKDGTGIGGSYKALWENDEEQDILRLVFNIEINKTSRLRNETVQVKLALNGEYNGDVTDKDAVGGIITYGLRGQKTAVGSLFEDTGTIYHVYTEYNEDVTQMKIKITFAIPKSIKGVSELIESAIEGKQPNIRVNIASTDGKSDGCGWVAYASENKVQSLGKLVFNNYIPMRKAGAVPCGDVNGDGKIKGNDATMLLKYLAGWDVTVDLTAADCNGDGKVKGNDATLLLKYLAGWDVTLGQK